MGLFDWLFANPKKKDTRKRVFISFAVEDSEYRDHLVNQARKNHSPFNFVDMSAKVAWDEQEWKKRCRTKIRRSHGVIALLSKNTHKAGGARWEMKCAREENKPIVGMHIKKNDKGAVPKELTGEKIIEWNWNNLENFINKL